MDEKKSGDALDEVCVEEFVEKTLEGPVGAVVVTGSMEKFLHFSNGNGLARVELEDEPEKVDSSKDAKATTDVTIAKCADTWCKRYAAGHV